MKLEELNKKLIAAARLNAPDDRVPYAFEKRIMALIADRPMPDSLALWARALWRAAVPCVVTVVLLGAGLSFVPRDETAGGETVLNVATTNEVSPDFETVLLAAVDQNDSSEEIW